MGLNIAIDPGTSKTGWCVFEEGIPTKIGTFRPKTHEKSFEEKALSLRRQLAKLLCDLQPQITETSVVAIEQFNPGFHQQDKGCGYRGVLGAMMKCACVQGMLWNEALNWGVEVRLVSKGRVQHSTTVQRAKAAGLIVEGRRPPSKDALAAYEIGVAAGFDRRATK